MAGLRGPVPLARRPLAAALLAFSLIALAACAAEPEADAPLPPELATSAPGSQAPGRPPGAALDLLAKPELTTIAVAWKPPADAGSSPVKDYVVILDGISTAMVDGSTTAFTLDGLASGRSYVIGVRAESDAGGGPGTEATATTKPGPATATAAAPTATPTPRPAGRPASGGPPTDTNYSPLPEAPTETPAPAAKPKPTATKAPSSTKSPSPAKTPAKKPITTGTFVGPKVTGFRYTCKALPGGKTFRHSYQLQLTGGQFWFYDAQKAPKARIKNEVVTKKKQFKPTDLTISIGKDLKDSTGASTAIPLQSQPSTACK